MKNKQFFLLILGVGLLTAIALLFAACKKDNELFEQALTHDTRSLTQNTTPMTIGSEVHAFDDADGISVYRIQSNSAITTYQGEYAVFPVNNGKTDYTIAVVYTASGGTFSSSPYLQDYIDNYKTIAGNNAVRGYKLIGWHYPNTQGDVCLTPGWDGLDVTINDDRKITKPLPCPRACD